MVGEGVPKTVFRLVPIYVFLVVMVNFMYQLDWVIECPDIWPSIILGVSLRTFLDETDV